MHPTGHPDPFKGKKKGVQFKSKPLKKQPIKKQPLKEQPLKEQPLKEQPLKEQPLKEQLLPVYILEIHQLQVGSGDSSLILIKQGNEIKKSILIDGGNRKENLEEYLEKHVNQKNGIIEIDIAIITHWDKDHAGNLYKILIKQYNKWINNYDKFIEKHNKLKRDVDLLIRKYGIETSNNFFQVNELIKLYHEFIKEKKYNKLICQNDSFLQDINCLIANRAFNNEINLFIKNYKTFIKRYGKFIKKCNNKPIYKIHKLYHPSFNDQCYKDGHFQYKFDNIQNKTPEIKDNILADFGDENISMRCITVDGKYIYLDENGKECEAKITPRESKKSKCHNVISLGFILEFYGFKFYTAGDSIHDVEIMLKDTLGQVDAMKISHHGSNSSTVGYEEGKDRYNDVLKNNKFLKELDPRIAMISCGSKYKHPHKVVIDGLNEVAKEKRLQQYIITNKREDPAVEKKFSNKKGYDLAFARFSGVIKVSKKCFYRNCNVLVKVNNDYSTKYFADYYNKVKNNLYRYRSDFNNKNIKKDLFSEGEFVVVFFTRLLLSIDKVLDKVLKSMRLLRLAAKEVKISKELKDALENVNKKTYKECDKILKLKYDQKKELEKCFSNANKLLEDFLKELQKKLSENRKEISIEDIRYEEHLYEPLTKLQAKGHIVLTIPQTFQKNNKFSVHYYTNHKKHYANVEIDRPGIIGKNDIDRFIHKINVNSEPISSKDLEKEISQYYRIGEITDTTSINNLNDIKKEVTGVLFDDNQKHYYLSELGINAFEKSKSSGTNIYLEDIILEDCKDNVKKIKTANLIIEDKIDNKVIESISFPLHQKTKSYNFLKHKKDNKNQEAYYQGLPYQKLCLYDDLYDNRKKGFSVSGASGLTKIAGITTGNRDSLFMVSGILNGLESKDSPLPIFKDISDAIENNIKIKNIYLDFDPYFNHEISQDNHGKKSNHINTNSTHTKLSFKIDIDKSIAISEELALKDIGITLRADYNPVIVGDKVRTMGAKFSGNLHGTIGIKKLADEKYKYNLATKLYFKDKNNLVLEILGYQTNIEKGLDEVGINLLDVSDDILEAIGNVKPGIQKAFASIGIDRINIDGFRLGINPKAEKGNSAIKYLKMQNSIEFCDKEIKVNCNSNLLTNGKLDFYFSASLDPETPITISKIFAKYGVNSAGIDILGDTKISILDFKGFPSQSKWKMAFRINSSKRISIGKCDLQINRLQFNLSLVGKKVEKAKATGWATILETDKNGGILKTELEVCYSQDKGWEFVLNADLNINKLKDLTKQVTEDDFESVKLSLPEDLNNSEDKQKLEESLKQLKGNISKKKKEKGDENIYLQIRYAPRNQDIYFRIDLANISWQPDAEFELTPKYFYIKSFKSENENNEKVRKTNIGIGGEIGLFQKINGKFDCDFRGNKKFVIDAIFTAINPEDFKGLSDKIKHDQINKLTKAKETKEDQDGPQPRPYLRIQASNIEDVIGKEHKFRIMIKGEYYGNSIAGDVSNKGVAIGIYLPDASVIGDLLQNPSLSENLESFKENTLVLSLKNKPFDNSYFISPFDQDLEINKGFLIKSHIYLDRGFAEDIGRFLNAGPGSYLDAGIKIQFSPFHLQAVAILYSPSPLKLSDSISIRDPGVIIYAKKSELGVEIFCDLILHLDQGNNLDFKGSLYAQIDSQLKIGGFLELNNPWQRVLGYRNLSINRGSIDLSFSNEGGLNIGILGDITMKNLTGSVAVGFSSNYGMIPTLIAASISDTNLAEILEAITDKKPPLAWILKLIAMKGISPFSKSERDDQLLTEVNNNLIGSDGNLETGKHSKKLTNNKKDKIKKTDNKKEEDFILKSSEEYLNLVIEKAKSKKGEFTNGLTKIYLAIKHQIRKEKIRGVKVFLEKEDQDTIKKKIVKTFYEEFKEKPITLDEKRIENMLDNMILYRGKRDFSLKEKEESLSTDKGKRDIPAKEKEELLSVDKDTRDPSVKEKQKDGFLKKVAKKVVNVGYKVGSKVVSTIKSPFTSPNLGKRAIYYRIESKYLSFEIEESEIRLINIIDEVKQTSFKDKTKNLFKEINAIYEKEKKLTFQRILDLNPQEKEKIKKIFNGKDLNDNYEYFVRSNFEPKFKIPEGIENKIYIQKVKSKQDPENNNELTSCYYLTDGINTYTIWPNRTSLNIQAMIALRTTRIGTTEYKQGFEFFGNVIGLDISIQLQLGDNFKLTALGYGNSSSLGLNIDVSKNEYKITGDAEIAKILKPLFELKNLLSSTCNIFASMFSKFFNSHIIDTILSETKNETLKKSIEDGEYDPGKILAILKNRKELSDEFIKNYKNNSQYKLPKTHSISKLDDIKVVEKKLSKRHEALCEDKDKITDSKIIKFIDEEINAVNKILKIVKETIKSEEKNTDFNSLKEKLKKYIQNVKEIKRSLVTYCDDFHKDLDELTNKLEDFGLITKLNKVLSKIKNNIPLETGDIGELKDLDKKSKNLKSDLRDEIEKAMQDIDSIIDATSFSNKDELYLSDLYHYGGDYKKPYDLSDIVSVLAFSSVNNQSIESITLDNNNFGSNDSENIAAAIQNFSNIKTLSLACNNLEKKGLDYFIKKGIFRKSLKTLNLSNNNIGTTGLAGVLKKEILPNITKLYLAGNKLSNNDIRTISNFGKKLEILEILDISNNSFKEKIDCSNFKNLKNLNISMNKGLKSIKLPSSLEKLTMNRVSNKLILHIIKKLNNLKKLKNINLSYNDLQSKYLKYISKHKNIEELSLAYCKLEDKAIAKIIKKLATSNKIRKLNLSGNIAGEETVESLIELIRNQEVNFNKEAIKINLKSSSIENSKNIKNLFEAVETYNKKVTRKFRLKKKSLLPSKDSENLKSKEDLKNLKKLESDYNKGKYSIKIEGINQQTSFQKISRKKDISKIQEINVGIHIFYRKRNPKSKREEKNILELIKNNSNYCLFCYNGSFYHYDQKSNNVMKIDKSSSLNQEVIDKLYKKHYNNKSYKKEIGKTISDNEFIIEYRDLHEMSIDIEKYNKEMRGLGYEFQDNPKKQESSTLHSRSNSENRNQSDCDQKSNKSKSRDNNNKPNNPSKNQNRDPKKSTTISSKKVDEKLYNPNTVQNIIKNYSGNSDWLSDGNIYNQFSKHISETHSICRDTKYNEELGVSVIKWVPETTGNILFYIDTLLEYNNVNKFLNDTKIILEEAGNKSILFPVHINGNHFISGALFRDDEKKNITINFDDSLKCKQEQFRINIENEAKKLFPGYEVKVNYKNHSLQKDSNNCGIYTSEFLISRALGREISRDTDHYDKIIAEYRESKEDTKPQNSNVKSPKTDKLVSRSTEQTKNL